jgi:hypothetical protein
VSPDWWDANRLDRTMTLGADWARAHGRLAAAITICPSARAILTVTKFRMDTLRITKSGSAIRTRGNANACGADTFVCTALSLLWRSRQPIHRRKQAARCSRAGR